MKKIIVLSALLLVASVGNAQAEDEWRYPHLISDSIATYCGKPDTPPTLKGVEIESSISLAGETGVYTYLYSIRNGSQSTGCIKRLEIDITRPDGTQELSTYGLKDYPEHVRKNIRRYPDTPEMIPVAFPDLPRRKLPKIGEVTIWNAGITVYGALRWSDALDQYVPPGDKLSGFIITTHGVPALREFKALPRYIAKYEDVYKMAGVTEDEYDGDIALDFIAFYDSIAFKGKTIGPTAPPAELVPIDFLENIISMKHEAVSLGWITNKGIETGLDQKLEAVKNKLRQGNNGAARNILKAFIHEVEAQGCESYDDCPRGKHLKPEAYALLKYNAQYLVDNMK